MVLVKKKRVYLNTKRTKYCIVELYAKKTDMQNRYKTICIRRGYPDKGHFKVEGVSLHYEKLTNGKLLSETGTVLLHLKECGAGVVAHELLHAVLWANKHKKYKKQYPIVIKNMKEEERILQNFTFAVIGFYNWYWKIKDSLIA